MARPILLPLTEWLLDEILLRGVYTVAKDLRRNPSCLYTALRRPGAEEVIRKRRADVREEAARIAADTRDLHELSGDELNRRGYIAHLVLGFDRYWKALRLPPPKGRHGPKDDDVVACQDDEDDYGPLQSAE